LGFCSALGGSCMRCSLWSSSSLTPPLSTWRGPPAHKGPLMRSSLTLSTSLLKQRLALVIPTQEGSEHCAVRKDCHQQSLLRPLFTTFPSDASCLGMTSEGRCGRRQTAMVKADCASGPLCVDDLPPPGEGRDGGLYERYFATIGRRRPTPNALLLTRMMGQN
jgi:hypothetical protein